MELRIDGTSVAAPEGMERVGALIDASLREWNGGGRVASRVWIDGGEVSEEAFDAALERPVAGIARLEVTTRSAVEVARDALDSAAAFGAQIALALRQSAAHYRGGDIAAAGEGFAKAADALVVLFHTLRSIAPFVEGSPGAALEEEVVPALRSLEASHRDGDWVAVADRLEHEIAAALERCARDLAQHNGA